MNLSLSPLRRRLDSVGLVLSGLCAVHCLASIVLVSVLGLGGQVLLAPAIHEVGLMLAIAVAALTLGVDAVRHARTVPLRLGAGGIGLMASALAVSHGPAEAGLTIAGVSLVAAAHLANLRHAASARHTD